ncbi:MAG: hypothetical protein R2778_02380 [Saprospiraceae bacterium]
MIAGVGILLSIVEYVDLIRIKDNDNQNVDSVQGALDRGNWASIILTAIVAYPIIRWMLPETMTMSFFGTGTREITSTSVFNYHDRFDRWCFDLNHHCVLHRYG